ncbi:MAG: secretin N-terminal domain-containing protein, partial [Cyanobacteria bacterium P01_A01_bin.17]
MPIPLILNEYEELTGKRIVRDNAVLGGSLSIETTRKLTRKEAARFIEQSFLLNGFAFIPAGDDTLKIIAFSGGRNPGSEGVPVITQIEDIPKDEESVITFILPVKNVNPEDAVRTLGTIFPLHQYGQFTPLPEASSIALTENTAVIRKILEVVKKIDLPPSQIEHKTITLERADAEEVAEALVEILELDSKDEQPTGTLQAAQRSATAQIGENGITPRSVTPTSGAAASASQSFRPRIRAIPRANRLLVVARPVDMAYIESLVGHFDEPLAEKNFVKYKLNYLSVSTFLPIVKDSLLRGLGGDEAQQVQISGGITGPQNTLGGGGASLQGGASGVGGGQSAGSGFGTSGGASGFGGGSSGGAGGLGGAGGSSASNLSSNNQDIGPQ